MTINPATPDIGPAMAVEAAVPLIVSDGFAELVAGASWYRVSGSVSDATLFSLRWDDGRTAYLKVADPVGPGAGAALLADEWQRLRWLHGQVPVPDVLGWHVDDQSGRAHLMLSTVPGVPANSTEQRCEVEALVRGLAAGLRRFHSLPVAECPFLAPLDGRLAVAKTRVQQGLVDESAFEPAYRRYSADRLYELLVQARPPAGNHSDLVVVHGDFSLANVLLDDGVVVGFVDVGACGVSDRYLDLAVAARSLAHHVSPEALGPFFVEYGIDYPDLQKIDFYVLLDEFF